MRRTQPCAAILSALAWAMAAPSVAQQGTDILSYAVNDVSAGWVPYGSNHKARAIDDAGVQGGRAIRIELKAPGAHPWDDGANVPITRAVAKGDPLVFAFWARAPKAAAGERVTPPFAGITQSHAPYDQVLKGAPTIGRDWAMVELRGVADRDYPAGELQASLQLSVANLTVDLGPAFVLDLKRKAGAATAAAASAAPPASTAHAMGATNQEAHRPMAVPAGRPTWADEFDGAAIDAANWRFDTARNAAGWYNNERQYYADGRPENARIEKGALVIEARRETLPKARFADWGGQDYTSARMVTRRTLGYGFYEVRATLPCGRGIWPAIWLLPPDGAWPDAGEIDIMEMVGSEPEMSHATVHSAAYNHASNSQRGAQTRVTGACTAAHDYQLDWQPDAITIGVDGRSYMRVERKPGDGMREWPFTRAYNLILNVAVGGDWAGAKGIDDTAFLQRMTVEHVRFWGAPAAK